MARYEVSSLFDIPLVDENLLMSFDEINTFLNNKHIFKIYEQYKAKYYDYLSKLTLWATKFPKYSFYPMTFIDYYHTCLNMDIKDGKESFESVVTFSSYGLLLSMANILEIPNADTLDNIEKLDEIIKNRIKDLRRIKSPQELKNKFPNIYGTYYLYNIKFLNDIPSTLIQKMWIYESMRGQDVLFFNSYKGKIEKEYGLDDRQFEVLRIRINCLDKFPKFIEEISNYFIYMINQFPKIEKWTRDNPVPIRFNESDIEKINLYILEKEIENIYRYARCGRIHEAQECVIIVEQLIKKYQEKFPQSDTMIRFKQYIGEGMTLNNLSDVPPQEVDFHYIISFFNTVLDKFPVLQRDIKLDNINSMNHQEAKDYIRTYIGNLLNNINDNLAHGAVEMTESELKERVRKLKAEIADEKLLEQERNLKKLILAKIQMVLEEIKPIAIQTGIGLFKGYYIYFYANGMVAIDRINGYGALYTMPYHVYQLAKDKKGLTEVRYMSEFGVKWHHHKNSSWLENARKRILEGTNNLTEEDVRAAQEVISIKFPYTLEELKQLEEWLKKNDPKKYQFAKSEIDRRKERAKEFDDIDSELAENITEDSSNDEGFDNEINAEIEELISSGIDSFKELYEYWKKHYDKAKTKRNPVVAAITKNRSRDEEGRYRCELCGCVGAKSGAFDSHHMISLANGGVDNIYNTICLCPNCHRDFHMGYLTRYQKHVLFEKIKEHIKEDCPEYEEKFLKMRSPVVENDESKNSNPLTEELFNIDWSSDEPKKGFKKGI